MEAVNQTLFGSQLRAWTSQTSWEAPVLHGYRRTSPTHPRRQYIG